MEAFDMICNLCEMGMNEFKPCDQHKPAPLRKVSKRLYQQHVAAVEDAIAAVAATRSEAVRVSHTGNRYRREEAVAAALDARYWLRHWRNKLAGMEIAVGSTMSPRALENVRRANRSRSR